MTKGMLGIAVLVDGAWQGDRTGGFEKPLTR